ncbi:MAG: M48 family metallopeptidase [Bacteroidota bacterium]
MKRAFFIPLCVLLFVLGGILPTEAQAQDELLNKVWKKLGADRPVEQLPVRLRLHVSHKPEVNAWTTPRTGDIYITRQMLGLVGSSEGEVAFILGHEIGHVIGYWTGLGVELQRQQMQSDLSSFLSILGLLFESEEERRNRYSQVEELLADSIGLYILNDAGYNPYDAAGLFGRLQMYSGTTDPLTRLWNPYISSHPFKENRIENLRRVMQNLEAQLASNESSTIGWLTTLVTALITYESTYGSYPRGLVELGPKKAYLIDAELAAGSKSGYRFVYSPVKAWGGSIMSFTIHASPKTHGLTGRLSFFTDKSGIIRWTHESRLATAKDPPIQ